jgi:nucleotide-binding universal stress UspA family protein
VTDETAVRPPGRIVVGVDGSETSKQALRWAVHQAELTGDTLEAITTWHIPSAAYGAPVPLPTGYDFQQMSQQTLDDAVHEVLGDDPAVKASTMVTEGQAAHTLLEAAKGADLLVVGSRGHGSLTGMLLGSVSEHCVAHSPCPVVVVRPDAP